MAAQNQTRQIGGCVGHTIFAVLSLGTLTFWNAVTFATLTAEDSVLGKDPLPQGKRMKDGDANPYRPPSTFEVTRSRDWNLFAVRLFALSIYLIPVLWLLGYYFDRAWKPRLGTQWAVEESTLFTAAQIFGPFGIPITKVVFDVFGGPKGCWVVRGLAALLLLIWGLCVWRFFSNRWALLAAHVIAALVWYASGYLGVAWIVRG
jgi:hypothetical protein